MATIPLYPYGYKLNFLGRKEIHEERAAVVRLIYEKYIEGMNRYAITWHLIKHEILRPRGDSCDWQYSMVSRILEDERYLGNEKYPPILSAEMFEAAQAVRQREKDKAAASRHESCNANRRYHFSGFIQCGSCGSKYIRGLQQCGVHRKASWRCRNYHLKNEGKCKASGNIYEEVLEVVCVKAYNRVLRECLAGTIYAESKASQPASDKTLEMLIYETIEQMKYADELRMEELQNDLNVLMKKRTEAEWKSTPLDLGNYETEKLGRHFEKYPALMLELDIEKIKAVFSRIVASEPGELKLILKNGNEIFEKYKPMRGQTKHAKENRGYTCKADSRT
ncbi:MAG: Recombinase [Firmicutes bacterium]|nr:Recombinase [Bacillota bacterium]